jgi:hypothetical protein
MPLVGFETAIPVFERAKTVRDIDRTATVIGIEKFDWMKVENVYLPNPRNIVSETGRVTAS